MLVAAGFTPLLLRFFLNLWSRPQYRFFPLALLGAAYLIRRELQRDRKFSAGDGQSTFALLAAATLLLGFATVVFSPWMAAWAALVFGIGAAHAHGGWTLVQRLIRPGILLLLIIPPPFNADEALTVQLRLLAVKAGSRVLDLMLVPHALNGNVLDVPQQRLFVEDACTGINSILFITAGTWLYAAWQRRSGIQSLAAVVLNISFVILGNLARIVIATVAIQRYGIDLLHGWKHEAIGMVLFATYVGLVFSTDRFITILIDARGKKRRGYGYGSYGRPRFRAAPVPAAVFKPLSPRLGFACAVVIAIFGGVQAVKAISRARAAAAQNAELKRFEKLDFKLPAAIGEWRMEETKDGSATLQLEAVFSKVWEYRNGNVVVSVAIDYPFNGFHDVTGCYLLQGWKLESEVTERGNESVWDYNFSRITKSDLVNGTLWFGLNEADGKPVPPQILTGFNRFKNLDVGSARCFQVQALVQSFTPLSAQDEQTARAFFHQVRRELVKQLPAQARGT
jgi:exosortase